MITVGQLYRARATKAESQLATVRALHTPTEGHNPKCYCGIPPHADRSCKECRSDWPCATVRALTRGDTE